MRAISRNHVFRSAVVFISTEKTWINQLGTPQFFIRAQTPLNIRGLTIQCVVSPGTSFEHHLASPDAHRSKGHVYFPLWESFGGKTRWLHLKFGEQAGVMAEAQVLRHFPDWPPPLFDPGAGGSKQQAFLQLWIRAARAPCPIKATSKAWGGLPGPHWKASGAAAQGGSGSWGSRWLPGGPGTFLRRTHHSAFPVLLL